MMHHMALVCSNLLAYPDAKAVIAQAQRFVSFVRRSHGATAEVVAAARHFHRSRTRLQSVCATRFTSVFGMLESLLNLQLPLRYAVSLDGSIIGSHEDLKVCCSIRHSDNLSYQRCSYAQSHCRR
jgi:hypothetical protein